MQAIAVLEKLRTRGFRFLALERYARYVAAERDGFVALLEQTPAGEIRQFSSAGYLMEGAVGLLVERVSSSAFVFKGKEVPATAELLARYDRFQKELQQVLSPPV